MGDFNANSPALRGLEWRPSSIRQWRGDSSGRGIAMRIRPGNVTLANIDTFISKVVGSPGFAVELLNDNGAGAPPLYTLLGADTATYAGGATGFLATGWQNNAGGAAAYTDVSDGSTATYWRNANALPAGSPITGQVAGNLITSNPLVENAYVYVTAKVQATSGTAYVRLFITLGGTKFYSPPMLVTSNQSVRDISYQWTYNPSTGRPWIYDTVDTFRSGSSQPWGIEVQGVYATTLPAQSFRVYDMPFGANQGSAFYRQAGFYSTNIGVPTGASRWEEKALTVNSPGGSLTVAANTWCWLHIYPWLAADGGNNFSVPVLKAPNPPLAAPNASATGEHRTVYETVLGPGGVIIGYAAATVGEMLPLIIEQSAAVINTQSQPYCDLPTRAIYNGITNMGGQITTAASTAYAGIRMMLGWQNKSLAPDAPLTVELRHGVGAETGGGTLDATVNVTSQDLVRNADGTVSVQDFLVKFPTALTLLATTLYTIRFVSTASQGRGWLTVVPSSKSSSLGAGVSFADVSGATSNGTSDHDLFSGSANNDGELDGVLISPPTGPASLTVVAVAAT